MTQIPSCGPKDGDSLKSWFPALGTLSSALCGWDTEAQRSHIRSAWCPVQAQ